METAKSREFDAPVAEMIHFALAAVYGRIVGAVAGTRTVGASALVGALVGAAIYAANFLVIAPDAFPWFEQSPSLTTLLNHLLFGAVAGGVFASLRNARTPSSVSSSARR